MIQLFPVDAICPVCRKACLDSFGEHAVHCKELPGFKYRHYMVRDVLFDICRRVGIFAKKEAHLNFLTDPSDGRSTLRPADVLVFGWVGGKHACVDLTGVSPLVGLISRGFIADQTALKAASGKAVELLSRVQRVMHNNVLTPRSTNVVFKRIGFAIQKGLAAQLVVRLPSTTIKWQTNGYEVHLTKPIEILIAATAAIVSAVGQANEHGFGGIRVPKQKRNTGTKEIEDLWKLCQSYGTVVDVYIPNRRSKAGKRFAFVRFIKVDNVDRLVENLCTLWIGRMHLHTNVIRFERTPSQVPRPSHPVRKATHTGIESYELMIDLQSIRNPESINF
uniref:Putative reverse transcriptase domain-containing protein n=1 Tax=Tanacetum cinerariifolium TaxID=118510 RepID=A0A699HA29_TANCI|nr:putative reverse transcriptase domain-containing protein [Tanacetum cinerariifolium]